MGATLRLPAIRIAQGERCIYVFGVDGKRLHEFTAVSRVSRDENATLSGYQRPEVRAHIRAIRRYIESEGALLPNAVVVAFDERVVFDGAADGDVVAGELVIPTDPGAGELDKPAWLVDGQQRAAAIRDADVDAFPIAVVGFVAEGREDQRAQFILVNSTKPLPNGLIHELLPDTTAHLPPRYARRKLPATLMIRLNTDDDSPFHGIIATPTEPDGYVKDNSVLKMIESSLYDGALYQYRDRLTGWGDEEQMFLHLKVFWTVVRTTWPREWVLPPRQSRLTHGVGIQALGYVMDRLTEDVPATDLPGLDLEKTLAGLKDVCAWTGGSWQFGADDVRRWNSLQNTANDVRRLSEFLARSLPSRHRLA